ncbi:MAG: Hsp33 family molecular chaperone HslO [Xanthomonadaceae bacterium]|nr:Hsp33 family molecular chaperone HslO [Xanthomonadaceae bacterium]
MAIQIQSSSTWVKALLTTGTVSGIAIDATDLTQKAVARHGFKEDKAIQSFGESVLGALLLASHCKKGEHINLNIRSSGVVFQAVIDAYPDGSVRGYVVPRESSTPYSIGENTGPWGDGLLSVLRTKDISQERPYIGTVPLVTGKLAKDLTFYWAQSEQVPTALGIVVNVHEGKVHGAHAFMVQALPGASDKDLKWIEDQVFHISNQLEPKQALAHLFQNATFSFLETKNLSFKCHCTLGRVERALALVGEVELNSMIENQNGAEVKCDFCSENYIVGKEKLQELIKNSRRHEP